MRQSDQKKKPTILGITLEKVMDDYPDLSHIGVISDEPGPGAINLRESGVEEFSQLGYFNPADPEYAKEDFEDITRYFQGEYYYICVRARAMIRVPTEAGAIWVPIESPGVWGIQSDDAEGILEAAKESLDMLKEITGALGVHWAHKQAERALEKVKGGL